MHYRENNGMMNEAMRSFGPTHPICHMQKMNIVLRSHVRHFCLIYQAMLGGNVE